MNMTKYGTIAKRSAALALAGVMACSCAMGVSAASNPAAKRDETVFVTLASDGTVQKATDSVWLHADAGLDGYTEDTGLADITMLKDTEQPSQDGSRLSFSTADTDAYYQGTAGTDLPVSAKITYTLDGTEMTAEQLAGQSGHLVMHIDLTNNSYQMKTVGGVSRRICTPFVTVATMTLDTDKFASVKAENGTVQTDSSKDLVAYVCLPGMKECFDGLLNGDLSELNDKLNDEVTLEADVTDFEMPMMYIAASTDASDFSKESELSDFDDLFDELDGLDDKLDEMMDGVDTLLKGSNDLNKGAGDLYTAVNTLNDGAATLQTGAHSAADGAATLSGGLNTLSGNSQSLRDGMQTAFTSTLASVSQQLKDKFGSNNVPDLAEDNYVGVINGLIAQVNGGALQPTVLAGITATLKGTEGQSGNMVYDELLYAYGNNDTALQNDLGDAMIHSENTLNDTLGGSDISKKPCNIYSAAVIGAVADLQSTSASLDSMKQLRDDINTYTSGVDSAKDGAAQLASGTAQLATGTDTLKDGTGKLLNGVSTLKDGTGTLVDGVQKLYDGVDEAYDKIQNNTGDISLDDLQDIKDTLEEVKTQRSNYSSFSGSADNTTGSVKFVMKVTAEKQEKEDAPAVETSAQDSGNGNFFANLWQRFVALFRK
jgi:putative membrane protein